MQSSESSRVAAALSAAWVGCLSVIACVQAQPPSPTPTPAGTFRVVALGDSYASGQGAPDSAAAWWNLYTPRWDDRRCNRSLLAGTAQAVDRLRQQGHAVEYESLACSGAKIEKGLIGPYAGSEPPNFPFPEEPLSPQVDELEELAGNGGVDAVTLSIGGNDIFFEVLVMICLVDPRCDLLDGEVGLRLQELPGHLQRLASALAEVPIASERVFLVGYPDPTQDANGNSCDRAPFGDLLAGISRQEATWIAEEVLPRLNHTLCTAAAEYGWTYVGGAAARFERHGWCAQADRWINTVEDSMGKQRHFRGAMHPNEAGYRAIGEEIAAALSPVVEGQPPISSPCPAIPAAPLPPPPSS